MAQSNNQWTFGNPEDGKAIQRTMSIQIRFLNCEDSDQFRYYLENLQMTLENVHNKASYRHEESQELVQSIMQLDSD